LEKALIIKNGKLINTASLKYLAKGNRMLVVHNEELLGILRDRYTSADISVIRKFLHDRDVLTFPQIGDTGLFPAARRSIHTGYTHYDRIWVRDNIHIANAHLLTGYKDIACASLRSLFAMFKAQKDRFDRYISGETDRKELSGRPHVRFQTQDGTQFAFEPWNAQNDALGYFLWFACTLILEGIFAPQPDDIDMLRTFVAFFESITFWSDEDCGHWEESPKIESSSIGTVLAGLNNYRRLLDCFDVDGCSDEKQLIGSGGPTMMPSFRRIGGRWILPGIPEPGSGWWR
jgi:phosphorylase kinase alpha/beta subunit